MQNLPIEINFLIGDYLFDCRKNPIIINKEFQQIFNAKTLMCEKVKISRKIYCKRCDKKSIWKARMIMNNLLTG